MTITYATECTVVHQRKANASARELRRNKISNINFHNIHNIHNIHINILIFIFYFAREVHSTEAPVRGGVICSRTRGRDGVAQCLHMLVA